jgi:hypothetical protein
MFEKIETSLLEGDIQSGSFTKKMTLDAIVGLIAWLLVERPPLSCPTLVMKYGDSLLASNDHHGTIITHMYV